MRALVVLLTLAGCGTPSSRNCRIDAYAAADVEEQGPIECGIFALGSDGGYGDMIAAQRCVLDAVAQARAFRLIYDVSDPVRHLRAGYTGFLLDGTYRLRSYAYLGDTQPHVTMRTCTNLSSTPSCTPAVGRACLECETPGTPTTLCRFE